MGKKLLNFLKTFIISARKVAYNSCWAKICWNQAGVAYNWQLSIKSARSCLVKVAWKLWLKIGPRVAEKVA